MTTDNFKIITSKTAWDEALTSIESYDFYHTFDYHMLSKMDDETPLLFHYESAHAVIALPLLVRSIPNSPYQDATSVYGYAGPICMIKDRNLDVSGFQGLLRKYLLENNIITVFSRLNPFIPHQEECLKDLGKIVPSGQVVNIDLVKNLDEQRSAYRRDTRSRVNKARRHFSVELAQSSDDIELFIDIYNVTMKKLNADASYYFENRYFHDFLDCTGFETDILLAVHNETKEVGAASMFVKTKNIVQYHLSGTHPDYFKLAPARLLLDEMRVRATDAGFTYFNLGGGYKGQKDALFDFKSSFSDDFKQFKVWQFVVNNDAYNELNQRLNAPESDFFPRYRVNLNN